MVLLSGFSDSGVLVIACLFLLPAVLVFWLLYWIFGKGINRMPNKVIRIFSKIGLFVISLVVVFLLLLAHYIITGRGLLE